MARDVFTFIVGGKAGEGVKKAGSTAAALFASLGRRVFEMDDYPSLIRGGHNFCAVSTATRELSSHYMKADLIVALDERSYRIHRPNVADGGVMVFNSDAVEGGEGLGVPMSAEAAAYPDASRRVGVASIAVLCAATGVSKADMADLIEREYKHDLENNTAYANTIYDAAASELESRFTLAKGDAELPIFTGNQAIALGAAAAGLDMYIGYPMTPASTILHYLAAKSSDLGITVVHPESEIAVANMAVGAAAAGARVMVGTSGGGFALMEEAYSFAGMAEAPVLFVMSSRPGPSTGVPTYTEQADLRFALGQGHGEFPRIVAVPGTVAEAFHLSAELLALVWEFQTPGMLLTEKHLSESSMTTRLDFDGAEWVVPLTQEKGEYKRYLDTEDGISPLAFPPSPESLKWSSYEHDERGITTEEGPAIVKMHDKRNRKGRSLESKLRGMNTVERYGDSGPLIFSYGSTTMSVLEALRVSGMKARVVQPIYLEPFPVWAFDDLKGERPVVVEQSSTGQFAQLMSEKTRMDPVEVVTRYDGRPFEPVELAERLEQATGGKAGS